MRLWIGIANVLLLSIGLQGSVGVFEIEVGEITWARSGMNQNALAFQTTSSGTTSVIEASSVNESNSWTPGFSGRIALFPVKEFGIDARYTGFFEWSKSRAVSTTGPSVLYSLNISSASPIDFTHGTQAIEDYKMRYESADLLFAWNVTPLYNNFFGIRAEIGPSFIYVNDRLNQVLSSPVFLKEYNIKSENYLVGTRLYGEFIGVPRPFIWGIRGSFGLYGDLYYQKSFISQSIPTEINHNFKVNDNWFSTVLQGEVFIGLTFFDAWRIKAGYGGELMTNLALATTQAGRSLTKGGIYPHSRLAFYGFFVSLELDLF
ncbi:MAG: hypothetical protein ACOYK9_02445 [Chlamydiia bacterium]